MFCCNKIQWHLLRCVSLISGIFQRAAKIFKKYMEVNHFLLQSCSLKRSHLVEWFFNYSTHRPCIVPLSSLVVLFRGNLLRWGQLSCGVIFVGGNCLVSNYGAIFLGGNCLGGNYLGANFLLGNCPRTGRDIYFCHEKNAFYGLSLFTIKL